MSVSFQVQGRGKPLRNLPKEVTIPSLDSKASELYAAIAKATGTSVHRIKITKGSDGSAVTPDTSVKSTGLRNRSAIAVKDLGPQVSWRLVFIIEYLGPLLIHPLMYLLRPWLYTNPNAPGVFPPPSDIQTLSMWLIVLHFAKRELETIYVHRFSASTMPAFNIFRNSAHYWLLAGINIAYWVYKPDSRAATSTFESQNVIVGLMYYITGEVGNFYAHIVLRNLRKPGTTQRQIPPGKLFELVTCPNYMFEILAWSGITLVTWSYSSVLFSLVASYMMISWAQKKERRYRAEFGDKYKPKDATVLPGFI